MYRSTAVQTEVLKVHKATLTRNILAVYRRASSEQLAAGLAWYDTAGEYAASLASEYGTTVRHAAGIIAALSPSTPWQRNVLDAREVLAAFAARAPLTHKCSTYGANVVKAARIASGEQPEDVLGGLKVNAFYACILGDRDRVCVDRWAARVALNVNLDKVSDVQYRHCAEAYARAAKILGVPAREVQAVTWVVIRAEHGIVD